LNICILTLWHSLSGSFSWTSTKNLITVPMLKRNYISCQMSGHTQFGTSVRNRNCPITVSKSLNIHPWDRCC
jgi:hypothetical protein